MDPRNVDANAPSLCAQASIGSVSGLGRTEHWLAVLGCNCSCNFGITKERNLSIGHYENVFDEAEALAEQLGLSRSELYTKALKAYLKKYNRNQILHKLNQVYSKESSELDLVMAKMQFMSLPHEDW